MRGYGVRGSRKSRGDRDLAFLERVSRYAARGRRIKNLSTSGAPRSGIISIAISTQMQGDDNAGFPRDTSQGVISRDPTFANTRWKSRPVRFQPVSYYILQRTARNRARAPRRVRGSARYSERNRSAVIYRIRGELR